MNTQARKPAGSTGSTEGQFAPQRSGEADVDLDDVVECGERGRLASSDDELCDECRDELTCRECGSRNDGGEGSDGLCGSCADSQTCPECGGESPDGGECRDCREQFDRIEAVQERVRAQVSADLGRDLYPSESEVLRILVADDPYPEEAADNLSDYDSGGRALVALLRRVAADTGVYRTPVRIEPAPRAEENAVNLIAENGSDLPGLVRTIRYVDHLGEGGTGAVRALTATAEAHETLRDLTGQAAAFKELLAAPPASPA